MPGLFYKSQNQETIEEDEKIRKQIMLYILSLLGVFFLITMSILLFSEGFYFYAILNLAFCSFLVIIIFLVHTGKNLRFYSIISIIFLQLFFIFLFHSGAGNQMAFVWYYLFPLVSIFLLGIRLGTFLSLLMIILSFVLNIFSNYIPFFVHIQTDKILRILFSYISIILFSLVFELTRLSTQKKLVETMTELNELAVKDSLTGLFNRRYMDEVIASILQQCTRSGQTAGFIMADLDYFKNYNDTYGHQAGDNLLSCFASMLKSIVLRQTDFVFRYGGEEFSIILSSTSSETVMKLAEEIIIRTREMSVPHKSSPFGIATVSAGAVFTNSPGDIEFSELVRNADKTLYEAKKIGRNCFKVKEI